MSSKQEQNKTTKKNPHPGQARLKGDQEGKTKSES